MKQERIKMTPRLAKTVISVVWAIAVIAVFSFHRFSSASGHTAPPMTAERAAPVLSPDRALVTRFDNAIQRRFLTEPNFGMARIGPVRRRSPHLSHFSPSNDEESSSVADIEKGGWRAALYLFGRRSTPKGKKGHELEKFDIRYRLNRPLTITADLKRGQVPSGKKLIGEVKEAFLGFQTPGSPNENNYEFTIGDWSYFAKPVRAANASCIQCHTDYVITEKLGEDKYKFRKRAVGDVNGVLVYGFARK
jgi:hypothetical protein